VQLKTVHVSCRLICAPAEKRESQVKPLAVKKSAAPSGYTSVENSFAPIGSDSENEKGFKKENVLLKTLKNSAYQLYFSDSSRRLIV